MALFAAADALRLGFVRGVTPQCLCRACPTGDDYGMEGSSPLRARRARGLFEKVTDDIRAAARIPEARRLSPQILRGAGEYGLEQIFGE
jgi:hypothetical protein